MFKLSLSLMLVSYLPQQKIVFQGDLFFLPNNDAPFGPPQRTLVSFAEWLKEKELSVETFAGVHGKTATIGDFRKATESTQPAFGR